MKDSMILILNSPTVLLWEVLSDQNRGSIVEQCEDSQWREEEVGRDRQTQEGERKCGKV